MTDPKLEINPKWVSGIKRTIAQFKKNSSHGMASVQFLESYVCNENPDMGDYENSTYPISPWEIHLCAHLRTVSLAFLYKAEAMLFEGDKSVIQDAHLGFQIAMYSVYCEVERLRRYPIRFGRQPELRAQMASVAFIGVGMWLGKTQEALNLARLLNKSCENNWFIHSQYPIFKFMLNLTNSYLKQGLQNENSLYPLDTPHNELLAYWSTSDLDLLSELVISACNFHTHQNQTNKPKKWFEFSNGSFSTWPVEINLLFRLREISGLTNPIIDHPIMNTALGQNLDKLDPLQDELLEKIIHKLESEGFNLTKVLDAVLKSKGSESIDF